jgi:hypothetical protein
MREEFVKSGVLDEAAAFDRWLAGEEPAAAPAEPAANVSESTAARLTDPAITEELRRMGEQEAGWDTVGGKMIRTEGPDGGRGNISTVTRTPWIPKAPWFKELANKLGKSDRSYSEVIEDAVAGKKLKAKERRTVEEMAQVAEQHVHGGRDENALSDEHHANVLESEAAGLETKEGHAEYKR